MTHKTSVASWMMLGAALLLAVPAGAQTFTVINTFNGTNGAHSMAAMIFDQAGNLYGTTSAGGLGKGVVFELSPNGSGGWTENVIYEFGSRTHDGATPYSPLIFDANGNLYGTTELGGTSSQGTVFELSPVAGGGWTETILHNFGSVTSDGHHPIAGLLMDDNGNLFGTTYLGGSSNSCTMQGKPSSCGTVYELSPAAGGTWTYSIIHDFSTTNDGYFPVAGLAIGPDGGLYGEGSDGYEYGKGVLFELIPGANNTWTYKRVHPWGNVHDGRPDGGYPYSTLIFDSLGNMFGTSNVGGTHGDLGTVFRFFQNSKGWDEENLHGFGNAPEGSYPESALIIDSQGYLYGTTNQGGPNGVGTVYVLVELANYNYGYNLLHNFTGGADGASPTGSLVMDSQGNLYGTAPYGGSTATCKTGASKGCGVVYEITP